MCLFVIVLSENSIFLYKKQLKTFFLLFHLLFSSFLHHIDVCIRTYMSCTFSQAF